LTAGTGAVLTLIRRQWHTIS